MKREAAHRARKARGRHSSIARPVFEPLESRWLFSADLFPAAEPPPADAAAFELVVVDAAVADLAPFLEERASSKGRSVEVFVLHAGSDGVREVTELLAQRRGIEALHLVSHGRAGAFQLGSTLVDSGLLVGRAGEFALWANALADDADLLLYGCDVGAGLAGDALTSALARLTGADVAASNDVTGAGPLGGNWNLEHRKGEITTATLSPRDDLARSVGVLALLAEDPFPNSGGLNSDAGGFGWASAWTADDNKLKANGGGLTEPSGTLPTSESSVISTMALPLDSTTASRDLGVTLGTPGTTAWFSLLVRPDDVSSALSYMGLRVGTTDTAFFGYQENVFAVQEAGGLGQQAASGISAATGQTAFLVLRADFAAGNDTLTLYVNPTPGLAAPDSPHVAIKSDLDLGSFDTITIAIGRGISANDAGLDELRIGTTFSDVAPGLVVTTTTDTNSSGIVEGNLAHDITWLHANRGASVSLREALIAAENTPGVNGIQFAITNPLVSGRHTITLLSPLPTLDDGVVIDGTTEADYAGTPVITIHGGVLGGSGVGLSLSAGASVIQGITFREFGQSAIAVGSAASVAVTDSLFESAGARPIDLGADQAVQTNDAGDADGGANDGLNFPVIYSALISGGNVTITGEARPGVSVQFFEADNGFAGHGGATSLIGTGTVGATGTAGSLDPTAIRFSFTFAQGSLAVGDVISALATESGARTSEFSANLAATEVNAAPVLDASRSPSLSAVLEDAAAPSGAVGTLVSALVDFASPAGQVDNVTDANSAPLLGIAVVGADTSQGSLWYTTDGGSAWSALGSPSVAAARLLAADSNTRIYFKPSANFSGTLGSAITFRAWDRTSGSAGGTADTTVTGGTTAFSTATDTAAVTVTAVNDAPTISAIADQTVAEDTASGAIAFTLADEDNAVGGLSVSVWSSDESIVSDDDLVVGGSGANRTLSFTPVANARGGPITIHVRVSDGTASTDTSFQVTVTAVNDAPVNTAPAAVTGEQDEEIVFSGATRISIADVDAGSSTMQVTLTADHGGTVTLSGTAGLAFTSGDGTADATVTFRGTRTALNTALDGLRYTPGSGHTGAASLTIATSDLGATGAGGAQTDTDVIALTLTPNVSASVTLSLAGIVFTEGGSATVLDGALTVADGDDTVLQGATVRITGNFASTQDRLTFTDMLGIAGTWNGTLGALTLSGAASVADYQSALRSVRYLNTSEAPTTATRTVTFAADDGAGLGAAASLTIDVGSVNDAPVITARATAAATEDAAYTFSTGAGTAITIADADAGTSALQVTLTASTGTLTLASTTGLTFTSGADGTASMTVEGTLADLLGSLDGLSFLASADFHGAATLQIDVDDGGHAGAGGALGDSATVAITVASVNDLPTLPVNTGLAMTEGGTVTFSAADLAAADTESGAAQITFRVALTPDHGRLTRSGVTLGAGGTFTQADIAAGLVGYSHDGAETPTDRVVFDILDGDGGTLVDQQMSFTISAVDDPLAMVAADIDVPSAGTVTLTPAMVAAADHDGAHGPVSFEVRNVIGGTFQRGSDPTPITGFTEAEIAAGAIRFVATPQATSGAFEVRATDGTVTTAFVSGAVHLESTDLLLLAMSQAAASGSASPSAPSTSTTAAQDTSNARTADATTESESADAPEDRTVMQMPVPRTPPAPRPPAGTPDGTKTQAASADGAAPKTAALAPPSAGTAPAPAPATGGVTGAPAAAGGTVVAPPSVTTPDLSALTVDAKALAVHEKTLRDAQFVNALDAVAEAQGEKQRVEALVVGSTTAVASSVSVGYLLWLMRGGALAASLLASLPAWRSLDPTPILSRGDDDEGSGEDGPDDPLESLFNRARDALGRRRGAVQSAVPNTDADV